jgi:hypothetical protein
MLKKALNYQKQALSIGQTPQYLPQFTNDATARKKARMDFMGGVENNQCFLSNCGFFSQFSVLNTTFDRQAMGKKPIIDFKKLPKE